MALFLAKISATLFSYSMGEVTRTLSKAETRMAPWSLAAPSPTISHVEVRRAPTEKAAHVAVPPMPAAARTPAGP